MALAKQRALRVYEAFERVIVIALLTLLMVVVVYGTWLLAIQIFNRVTSGRPSNPETAVAELHAFFERFSLLHEVFGAFLLILIGLELMKTVVAYLDRHELHVEVVFTVAMIAIARHAIGLDIETTSPLLLVGMGVLVLALAAGYFLFRKTMNPTEHR